jgi:hypothetical protein
VNATAYKLREACRAPHCPVCELEQQNVQRYLDNQFYENVNNPKWREKLRASLGFCHEHAWLAVDKRLGDALGFSIIYRDIVNSVLKQLEGDPPRVRAPRGWTSSLGQIPERVRTLIQQFLTAITRRKRCPVCEYRDATTREILLTLVKELKTQEIVNALQTSAGLCFPHLRLALEQIRDADTYETLLRLQRKKLESLRAELDEFIRKNDYQFAGEGFGSEGDAWLRAIGMVVAKR